MEYCAEGSLEIGHLKTAQQVREKQGEDNT